MWVQYGMGDINCLGCIISCCYQFHNHIMITLVCPVISQGETPLHWTAYSSSDTCCKLLIDHHADIEANNDQVSVKQSAQLYYANYNYGKDSE